MHANIPAEFFLCISGRETEKGYWARTMWRRGNVLGIAFTEPPENSEPLLVGVSQGHGPYRA